MKKVVTAILHPQSGPHLLGQLYNTAPSMIYLTLEPSVY